LETSNAYFLVGIYYHEVGIKGNHKSIACFKKSLAIREKIFGCDGDACCSDCLLNLGLLYKQRGYNSEAEDAFKRAMKIRSRYVGGDSLSTANVQEEMGKFYLELGMFEESYKYLRDCFETRSHLFKR